MCNCWEFDCLFVVSSVGFAHVVCIYKGHVASSKYVPYLFTVYFTKLPCHIIADGFICLQVPAPCICIPWRTLVHKRLLS